MSEGRSMDRSSDAGAKALKPNEALGPLSFLLGDWDTEGTHPLVPGTLLQGRTSFSWHEGGAFLIMRSEIDHPNFRTAWETSPATTDRKA